MGSEAIGEVGARKFAARKILALRHRTRPRSQQGRNGLNRPGSAAAVQRRIRAPPGRRGSKGCVAWIAEHSLFFGRLGVALFGLAVEFLFGGARLTRLDFAFQNVWISLAILAPLIALVWWGWAARKEKKLLGTLSYCIGAVLLLLHALVFLHWKAGTSFGMMGFAYAALLLGYWWRPAANKPASFVGSLRRDVLRAPPGRGGPPSPPRMPLLALSCASAGTTRQGT